MGRTSRDTSQPLLEDVQAYLHMLLMHQAPDTVLAQAWDEFYRVYDALIRRFVVSCGTPQKDVDDCVQEVWAEVAQKLPTFQRSDDRPGLRAWLYRVARSKATDVVRRKVRRPANSLDAASQAGLEPASDEPQPWETLERRWEHAMVNAVVTNMRDDLSEVNYQVACQRLLEQRTTQEVADNLNLSPAQVRYRQHRVLKKVRVHLGIYTGEPIGAEA